MQSERNPFYFRILFMQVVLFIAQLAAANAEPSAMDTTEVTYNEHQSPWKDKNRAIVLDAYERNHIDWFRVVKNKQIRAFIGKASDGMPAPYSCSGNETEKALCKKNYKNYFMKQQLYHTRRMLAKNLGLKWGAYHLGRPGNPIEQANHFLEFAKPENDELIALDIEHDDPKKWISFEDAETFVRHIHARIGRYPVLYTNHFTARKIAERRAEFPLLARLPLWYARFRDDISGVFPMGNWENYSLWQFSAGVNCNKKKCLYRVNGAPDNIDVNITRHTIAEFDKAWPFDGLVPELPKDKETILVAAAEPPTTGSISMSKPASDDVSSVGEGENDNDNLETVEKNKFIAAIDDIVIPAPAPRDEVIVTDVVNLTVRIKKRDVAMREKKNGGKADSQGKAIEVEINVAANED